MDQGAAQHLELSELVVPRRGLDELLRGWTSDGQLFEALGAISDVALDVQWSDRDIARRAGRVLLDRISAAVGRLPDDAREWTEHLPISSETRTLVSSRPHHPTNWPTTARRFGWPARQFVGRPRSRIRDETALTTMAWTAVTLSKLLSDVRLVAPLLASRVEGPIEALVDVAERELQDIAPVRPGRLDIRGLATSGQPWSDLSAVAGALLQSESDLPFLAYEVIEPDPDLAWRLFHLSVLGEVLRCVREVGGHVRWRAPLVASLVGGPQFEVTLDGSTWDVWFEAGSACSYYGIKSHYAASTAAVLRNERSIGADILLLRREHRAIMFECKWSASGTYVGRDGYHQASSYALEMLSNVAPDVHSYVVGPSSVVPATSAAGFKADGHMVVGATNIDDLHGLLESLLAPM